MALHQNATGLQCPDCGRTFDAYLDSLKPGDECPSDDCPSKKIKLITTRMLRDATTSVDSAAKIIAQLNEEGVFVDIQAIRSAANQARQAAMGLDQLCGFVEAERIRR